MRRILFSAQRDEGRFLLEWVAYHKAIGFTDIILYSNDCSDGSDELADALDAAGEITHRRHSPGTGIAPQQNAARLAAEEGLFRDGDLVMWLDLDEYLCVNVGDGRLDDLIEAAPRFDALLVAWRRFGDGGNAVWPGRQISEDFVGARAAREGDLPYAKTLFRWSDKIARMDIHRPIPTPGQTRASFRAFTSAGVRMPPRFLWSDGDKFNCCLGGGDHFAVAQVNHYTIRAWDVFQEKKARGRGNRAHDRANERHTRRYYERQNFDEVDDRRILRHLSALDAEIGRLQRALSEQLLRADSVAARSAAAA